ncbi:MAG TPA: thioesterase family protein [Chitinophagaceae bacterium]|nr:thioesterase family protein [Chitinophagaceae bacterium]
MQHLESFYTVRFSDCDPFRHLNNARYIDYLLNAREDHLKTYYDMDLASFYKKGVGWVVMQHEISYLRPAALNEKICIRSGLLETSAEHLHVEMLMLDEKGSHLKALMHTTFIPINLNTGKKEPHSAEFMDFINDKLLPGIEAGKFSTRERIAHWQKLLKSLPTA